MEAEAQNNKDENKARVYDPDLDGDMEGEDAKKDTKEEEKKKPRKPLIKLDPAFLIDKETGL